jgi:hypothetical protein
LAKKQTLEFGELSVDVDVDVGLELAEATQMMDDMTEEPPVTADLGSFLATGAFSTSTISEGLTIDDPNALTSIRLQDHEAAMTTLERILIYSPNLLRVKVELGAS